MGDHVVIINSAEVATQILNRAIYSDRPRFVMAGEMYGIFFLISRSESVPIRLDDYSLQNGLR